MPRRYPTYPKKAHPSGRAVIQWAPFFGKGKSHYLAGKWESSESRAEFNEIIARIDRERAVSEGPRQEVLKVVPAGDKVYRVATLFKEYLAVIKKKPSQFAKIRSALRMLLSIHGAKPARAFDSADLIVVQEAMVKKGWTRDYVNQGVSQIKKMFGWAVPRKRVPLSTYTDLLLVQPLHFGETDAPDNDPIQPVRWRDVRQVLPHVSQVVADMLRIQFLTGMRSNEVTGLRMSELNSERKVWIYRKEQHKTKRFKKDKVVCFGPRAQKILSRYIQDGADYLFTPAASVAEHLERRARDPNARPRATNRKLAKRYDSRSYFHAIVHGLIRLAKASGKGEPSKVYNAKTDRFQLAKPREWLLSVGAFYFHPHQLRHSRVTITADKFDPQHASAQSGNTLTATQIYNHESLRRAKRVARETG